ncbi:aldo/keto reductase protein (plasmid) [Rhizobium etli bv. mimosae str. IE4771]|uniref:Aldo/keto reductase protein n=1 Tax=Rhizobium etli bv. mimosae str. IE4771 TaxID=1432050 RepID=A0A060I7F0_RHIET|nr:aldo/keto reductase protein [Rhizobium sp. IE4771]
MRQFLPTQPPAVRSAWTGLAARPRLSDRRSQTGGRTRRERYAPGRSAWQPGNFEKNVEAVRQLNELAASKGATVSQLALAWLLAQGNNIVPIPGSRHAGRVAENIGAADLVLTEEDLVKINEILPHGGFGERYAKEFAPTWI